MVWSQQPREAGSKKEFLNLCPDLRKEVRDFLIMKRLLFFMVSALLTMSCNKDSEQDWSGMEYFTFEISGKVTDTSGEPLTGISVAALGSQCLTFSDGTYILKGQGYTETEVLVNISDVDAEENGGLYMGTSMIVALDYVKGAHGPYLGLFGKSDVDAVLQSRRLPSVQ